MPGRSTEFSKTLEEVGGKKHSSGTSQLFRHSKPAVKDNPVRLGPDTDDRSIPEWRLPSMAAHFPYAYLPIANRAPPPRWTATKPLPAPLPNLTCTQLLQPPPRRPRLATRPRCWDRMHICEINSACLPFSPHPHCLPPSPCHDLRRHSGSPGYIRVLVRYIRTVACLSTER